MKAKSQTTKKSSRPKKRLVIRNRKNRTTLHLLLVMLFVGAIGGALAYASKGKWDGVDIISIFSQPRPTKGFGLDNLADGRDVNFGGVQLGMSPQDVQRLHPTLSIAQQVNGDKRFRYFQDDASFTVWFDKTMGSSKAYRMRFDKAYYDKTEAEVMNKIAKAYGRPNTTECTRKQVPAIRTCTFKWLGKDGIAMTFHLRSIKSAPSSNGLERLELAMEVVDTFINGKRMRKESSRQGFFKAS